MFIILWLSQVLPSGTLTYHIQGDLWHIGSLFWCHSKIGGYYFDPSIRTGSQQQWCHGTKSQLANEAILLANEAVLFKEPSLHKWSGLSQTTETNFDDSPLILKPIVCTLRLLTGLFRKKKSTQMSPLLPFIVQLPSSVEGDRGTLALYPEEVTAVVHYCSQFVH